jgi:large subunit ribosomal protein L25
MQCLASELPSRVEIEISDLEIGDSVHVEELIEQDSRISTDPEVTIVSVLAPRLTVDKEIALAAEEEEVEEVEGEDAEGEAAEGEEAAAPEGEGEASGGESSS